MKKKLAIYYETDRGLERKDRYLARVPRVGHPSFDDPYGVWQTATPRDVWLDDRMSYGKEIGG